ncbi:MAG: CoA transferase [Chloroflexi bacterium]|nr:CoA transferase [Chloroflexota bacterium]
MSYDFWKGINVLEWGTTIATAFHARMLGDMGARVVKVEPPTGDPARRAGPFPAGVPNSEKSGLFLALNTNKFGITLDPTCETGRAVFGELVKATDILVVDSRPSDLARWRLTFGDLKKLNASLIMVSITPFGATGPYQDFKASDLTIFQMSGYARAMVRGETDPVAKVPVRAQTDQVAMLGGLSATTATSIALLQRAATKQGTFVDVSLWEAMCMLSNGGFAAAAFQQLAPGGNDEPVISRGTVATLEAKSGYVVVSPREDDQWVRWIELIGSPAWANEPRFATRQLRSQNWDELEPLLAEWTSQRTKEETYHMAQAAEIPSFPMNTVADLFRSEQLRVRGAFQTIEHPVAGKLPYPTLPFRPGDQDARPDSPAPRLGEHTENVLAGIGVTKEEQLRLHVLGVI